MPPFTLLIKPAGADCNLRCEYCFYLEKAQLYSETSRHRMTEPVLERVVQSYMATEQPTYSFSWQGGEPTLMGVDFFRQVTDFQTKFGKQGTVVTNGLQTNATLIDDAFAKHLRHFRFLLGCSLDGPPEIHDHFRVNGRGRPSHADVMRGIKTLRRNGVEFNILVLVSQANVHRAREVYRYLTDQGFLYQQYIPCVEFDAEAKPLPFAITGREWGDFLCELFDEWFRSDTLRVSIRHFDSVLVKMVDGIANVCAMGKNCRQYFVVEHNGDIYPCDFFVDAQLRLGNVHKTPWEEAWNSQAYREFGKSKCQWHEACSTCNCVDLCQGDCLKHRIYGEFDQHNLSWLCDGWKQFYQHTRGRFSRLADELRRQRKVDAARQVRTPQAPQQGPTGRNAPCPCGSGRKYKKCCGG